MIIRCRPRWTKRLYALMPVILVPVLVYVMAASVSVEDAGNVLAERADVALMLLRTQLGGLWEGDEEFPRAAALVFSQSPLLAAMKKTPLHRTEELDEPPSQQEEPVEMDTPVAELPEESEQPLVILDNGVSARTLVPSSGYGYVVTGDVYVDNRSDKQIDSSMFNTPHGISFLNTDEPQVLIVHTHGSEAYTMPPGQSYIATGEFRTEDERCSVVRVGDEIAAVLEAAGIRVLHDKTLHDHPRYSGAYERSLVTVERYLTRYPSIVLVLDIHRDAISDADGTVYKLVSGVAGVNTAQMCFVVGTDGGGLSHPYWQENLRLAAAVQQTLCSQYPTLMRPITVRNSRYNQHVSVGALLVEVGAAGNSPQEAIFSARLLGEAIVETLLEKDALFLQETVE